MNGENATSGKLVAHQPAENGKSVDARSKNNRPLDPMINIYGALKESWLGGLRVVTPMITKTSYVRLGAFAAVLLLSSALLVTLFDEASAATIEITEIGDARGGSHDITVDIVVPDNQRIPIEKLTAAIETRADDEETKTSTSEVSLASLASCGSVIGGCPPGEIDEIDGKAGVLTAVKFNDAFVNGNKISNGYFGTGELRLTHEGGYGYDDTGPG